MPVLERPGANIFYEKAGTGAPALVLVHGGMCSHADWRHQVAALAREFTVLAPDLRAHGASTGAAAACDISQWTDDLLALLAVEVPGRAILAGHSLASRIVAEAAFRAPARVAGLVLVDGSRSFGGFAARERATGAPPPMKRPLAEILDLTIGPHADAATRAGLMAAMAATPPEVMNATVRAIRTWDETRADAVWAGLAPRLPVLAIQSTYHDAHTPRHSLASADETTPFLDWLRTVHRAAQIRILPRTGHFSMLERAGEVTEFIRAFARGEAGENPA